MTTGQVAPLKGVYEDANGQWWASLYRDGRRRKLPAKDVKDANAKRVRLEAEADAGLGKASGSETVAQAVTEWLEVALPPRELAPATLNQYRAAGAQITKGLGRVKLSRLRVQQIDRFLAELGQTYAKATVVVARKSLGQILADAKRRRVISENIIGDTLSATGLAKREPRALSEDEIGRFFEGAAGLQYEHLWTLALDSGARRGELLGLAWPDVDLEAGTITIRQQLAAAKGGGVALTPRLKTRNSRRTARISPAGVAALRAQHRKQAAWELAASEDRPWRDTGLVFTTDTGNWIDPANLERSLQVALRLAKLDPETAGENITLHWFRHTHTSHLVDGGVDAHDVAAQIGDSLETVLRVYYHGTRPSPVAVSDTMGALFERIAR